MAPLNMVRLRGLLECPKRGASAILRKKLTRSQLGRLIYSPAPHISLVKIAYRALSNQVLTVYPLGLTRVTMYIAVKDFVFMEPSATADRVRDELCFILERCGIRSIAERPQSHRQMLSFRQREGAFLLKTPDLVLPCFDAPRSFTIVDIKVIDPAAASYVTMTYQSHLFTAIVP